MTEKNPAVPALTTALTGPLHELEKIFLNKQTEIEAWFRTQWQQTPAPVYGSVDLRNCGFKIAPVDMNLFPAGFNNLNQDFLPLGIHAAQATVEKKFPNCTKILLVPESHTRNLFYWENVLALQNILSSAGYEVVIGTLLAEELKLELPSGKKVNAKPLTRKANRVGVDDFDPCIVWLNNDLTEGVPEVLQGIEQAIAPPLELGWHQRLKSVHFNQYQLITEEFSKMLDIDPWLINPLFQYCGQVDFMERTGEECLAKNVEDLLKNIQKKYDQYNIEHDPFVVVKSDSGTYGMSVMVVKSAEQVLALNRKQRTKMAASKGSKTVQRVIMQEGVYSFETWGDDKSVAEPVVYMLGQYVIGGFYRVHKNKGSDESLNAPGMQFEPLQFQSSCSAPEKSADPDSCPNRFYAYGVVARLSMLAAAREREAY